jgi:hypothetical protein
VDKWWYSEKHYKLTLSPLIFKQKECQYNEKQQQPLKRRVSNIPLKMGRIQQNSTASYDELRKSGNPFSSLKMHEELETTFLSNAARFPNSTAVLMLPGLARLSVWSKQQSEENGPLVE